MNKKLSIIGLLVALIAVGLVYFNETLKSELSKKINVGVDNLIADKKDNISYKDITCKGFFYYTCSVNDLVINNKQKTENISIEKIVLDDIMQLGQGKEVGEVKFSNFRIKLQNIGMTKQTGDIKILSDLTLSLDGIFKQTEMKTLDGTIKVKATDTRNKSLTFAMEGNFKENPLTVLDPSSYVKNSTISLDGAYKDFVYAVYTLGYGFTTSEPSLSSWNRKFTNLEDTKFHSFEEVNKHLEGNMDKFTTNLDRKASSIGGDKFKDDFISYVKEGKDSFSNTFTVEKEIFKFLR